MQDEEFDNFIRNSARSYNEPPAPDVEGMWAEIEKQYFDKSTHACYHPCHSRSHPCVHRGTTAVGCVSPPRS